MKPSHCCELCSAIAAVYCPSDAAFLCYTCDAKVHGVNFLVARHVRHSVETIVSGGVNSPSPLTDDDDDDDDVEEDDSDSLSSSSSSVSSTTNECSRTNIARVCDRSQRQSIIRDRQLSKAEGIFVNWYGKLGVGILDARVRDAFLAAMRVCLGKWTVLPFRICLAASMWFSLRLRGGVCDKSVECLKRLEEISGVPARIILAAESKLDRAVRVGRTTQRRRRIELKEGWAEC